MSLRSRCRVGLPGKLFEKENNSWLQFFSLVFLIFFCSKPENGCDHWCLSNSHGRPCGKLNDGSYMLEVMEHKGRRSLKPWPCHAILDWPHSGLSQEKETN